MSVTRIIDGTMAGLAVIGLGLGRQMMHGGLSGLLFMADDPAQSIFRYYSWRERGIPVVGHTRRLHVPYQRMPSGAGHDAMNMARITRAGMIFIPCRGGISHNPDEYAAPADIAGGCAPDSGFVAGERVAIVADDYGRERTVGEVVRATRDEVVVLRRDAALGDIAVHYPRAGYRFVRE